MTKEEFLQAFLDTTDEQKVQFAHDAGRMLFEAFGRDRDQFLGFMRATAAIYSAADGKIHATEVGIYNVATGDNLSNEQFFEMTKAFIGQEGVLKTYYDYVATFPHEVRMVLAYFCLSLVGYDDTFTQEEVAFLLPLIPELD